MNHQDWRAHTRQLNGQVAAITGRDLRLWLFTFIVVLVLAMGVLLLGFSNLLWTRASHSALELVAGLVLLVLSFAGYVLHKRYGYTKTREELMREIIYSEKLQSLSLIDPLTQTFNLRYLDQVLPREINRANRHGTTITFMVFELAGWAKVVKKKSDLVGDQMLMAAAQLLKDTLQGSDIVLRYDIDRFLLIMPETNEQQACCARKRMLHRLDSWNLESNALFELDFRIGLAAYSRGADADRVLKLAVEGLQSNRPPATTNPPSRDLANCGFQAGTNGLRRLTRCACMAVAVLMTMPAWSQEKPKGLGDMSIEDLMNIEVTSVSRKPQQLSRITSAISVITQDDIRHSGATNIPDLLRMVPGLDVAQINGSAWEISSRGLNSQFANKLLVLIDGRTVYSPLFAGVYWDIPDVPMEDIERIEVIRGPGATVWGANAVNGVINIITKSATETQGGLLTAGGGTYEPGFGVVQYGGKLSQPTSYRVFTKGFDYYSFPSFSGQGGHDGWNLLHGGFRIDSNLTKQDSLTVQGDLYEGREGEVVNLAELTPPFNETVAVSTNVSGGDVLGRWNHIFSPHSDTSLQFFFDRAARDAIIAGETVSTVDVDFQHHIGWGSRQDFVWGAGYRLFSYNTTPNVDLSFTPTFANRQVVSMFVQDEIALIPHCIYFTMGTKVEHNDFTGFEFEPSARINWSLTGNHMLWAGYSRAVRTPSPTDIGIRINIAAFPGPVLLTTLGSPRAVSEDLDAFEAGYRTQLRANISLDLAAFYNRYENLETFRPGPPFLEVSPSPPHVDLPLVAANEMRGEAHGLETAVTWELTKRWTLRPAYAFEQIHLRTSPASQGTGSVSTGEGSSPRHQAQLRSNVALLRGFEWNTSAYFVGRLPAEQVPSYTRLDAGLTWRASERLGISFVGQNLLRDHHLEARSNSVQSSLVKRGAYAKFTWQF